ncbi:MAG: hypothetical protein GTN77_01835, partial [Planctomycetales bacterium]|nr:hypothetical protein [Planctomycetales bacterium]
MLKDLVPEVHKNMHMIAREKVRVKRLEEQIAKAEQRLARKKGEMQTLLTALETGQSAYSFAGRSYSAAQVQKDLANRLKCCKTSEATLESWQQRKAAMQQGVEAAQQKLEDMLAVKRELEVEVEHLKARLGLVEAAKASSQYQFDDSRLGRVKELV